MAKTLNSQCRGPGSSHGQGTRSYPLQLTVPRAATETQCSQINNFLKGSLVVPHCLGIKFKHLSKVFDGPDSPQGLWWPDPQLCRHILWGELLCSSWGPGGFVFVPPLCPHTTLQAQAHLRTCVCLLLRPGVTQEQALVVPPFPVPTIC